MFESRAELTKHPVAKRLLRLMANKKSNLALSADVTTCNEVLSLAKTLGPYLCLLKLHVDILQDFNHEFIQELQTIAKANDFLIFEDRKFADIGHTVVQQYSGGIYRIAEWADIVNAHVLPGPSVIQGLAKVGVPLQRGLLLLAQMSSAGNLLNDAYTRECVAMAMHYPEFVLGFISQRKVTDDLRFIHMTPGVQLNCSQDNLGQQYVTPEQAILENKSDIIIVGRGILQAQDKIATTQTYQQVAWDAYQETILAQTD